MKQRLSIPVTGVGRTLLDLGAVAPAPMVELALFNAIDRRLVTWDELAEVYVAHDRPGRRGLPALRSILDRNFGERVPESRLEVLFERYLERWGVERPERQVDVFDQGGFVGRLDYAFSRWRIGFETDGRSVHARRAAFDRDHDRRNRIKLAGWDLLVFTATAVLKQPDVVRSQVVATLEAAGAGHTFGGVAPTTTNRPMSVPE